jgi:hypothetical protein
MAEIGKGQRLDMLSSFLSLMQTGGQQNQPWIESLKK